MEKKKNRHKIGLIIIVIVWDFGGIQQIRFHISNGLTDFENGMVKRETERISFNKFLLKHILN